MIVDNGELRVYSIMINKHIRANINYARVNPETKAEFVRHFGLGRQNDTSTPNEVANNGTKFIEPL